MGEKLVVGPIDKGLKKDTEPFNIDNDNFPVLLNAYQWRGRIKRKRGTQLLTRLQRSIAVSGNLIAGSFTLNTRVVIGSINIVGSSDGTTYKDTLGNGTLTATGGTGVGGTINYATGVITIIAGSNQAITGTYSYYTGLPVMGLEDLVLPTNAYPGTLAFDTTYSYNIVTTDPYTASDVSFYKNPANGTYAGYVAKGTSTPLTWNGQNYQQFWTVNYQGALWATNGIGIPFTGSALTAIGMQFAPASSITYISNTTGLGTSTITLTITGSPLVVGDFVFFNEWTGGNSASLNFQTGYVTSVVGTTFIITFPDATLGAGPYTPGIIQYLTNRSSTTIDCIRWYDGNPNGTSNFGWVNFMPPLSQFIYSVAELPAAQYYLVGARMIMPFKDRLLFIGPVVQTSVTGALPIYLQDTVIYSQNGTPYYTASFTGNPSLSNFTYFPLLVPVNQTATASAYFEDQTGFGGFISAGIDQPATTVSSIDDVLGIGFRSLQTKLVYTGNDFVPFVFYIINSELGSSSTFSMINMDKSALMRGDRGYIAASQTNAERIDLDIPDEVFEMQLLNNGAERFCAQRDFINEWVHFTYPVNNTESNQVESYIFPTQTLQLNYRANTWAVFDECFTTYGQFKKLTGFVWETVGDTYPIWDDWNDPWEAGEINQLEPNLIGGNQEGFVIVKGVGTGEQPSLFIDAFVAGTLTVPNHCLNNGDYIIISGALGTIGPLVNGFIFSIVPIDANTFSLNPPIGTGTYLGGGLITRLFYPIIQTRQFPTSWGLGRKTRLGPQQYLLTSTKISQITLQIFLSTDNDNPWNAGPFLPSPGVDNNTLIYSQILYTCPENTNLGLTAANINLNMIPAFTPAQLWHRVNTSLIGDTIQLGFTMSNAQMRTQTPIGDIFTITGISQASSAVITAANTLSAGNIIQLNDIQGMSGINFNPDNFNYYYVISANSTSVTLNLNSSAFPPYISGGTIQAVKPIYQTDEIELHGFILDINPSSLLA
jgi:hypothetical protein